MFLTWFRSYREFLKRMQISVISIHPPCQVRFFKYRFSNSRRTFDSFHQHSTTLVLGSKSSGAFQFLTDTVIINLSVYSRRFLFNGLKIPIHTTAFLEVSGVLMAQIIMTTGVVSPYFTLPLSSLANVLYPKSMPSGTNLEYSRHYILSSHCANHPPSMVG